MKVGEERFRPILNKNMLLHPLSNLPPMSATIFATNVRHHARHQFEFRSSCWICLVLDAGGVTVFPYAQSRQS